MQKFNKIITVEVSVDTIAQKLVASFGEKFEHAENVAEAVVGSMLSNNSGLGYLYNALNGYTNGIDFEKGQLIECKDTVYSYVPVEGTDNMEFVQKRVPIGLCTIKDINLYTANKLFVEFEVYKKDGTIVKEEKWVCHTDCSGIQHLVMADMH